MDWRARLCGFGLLVATLAAPGEIRADSPVVVEFFTSQGCASCPPADAVFSQLARQPGVVALALHVDYWDYLGWKDPFGRAEHTERQRVYAKAHKERTIYTPQMVVHGADLVIGHEEATIRSRIAAHREQPAGARVSVRRVGDAIEIMVEAENGAVGRSDVHVVTFEPEVAMTVSAGENEGYHHTFANVVTDWDTVAEWGGAEPLTLRHEGGSGPLAVLIQIQGGGPILSAAEVR